MFVFSVPDDWLAEVNAMLKNYSTEEARTTGLILSVVSYVPDPTRAEQINIGIVVRDLETPERSAIRFTNDWSRLLRLDPQADIDMLKSLETDWQNALRIGSTLVDEALRDACGCVQVSLPRAVLVDHENVGVSVERMMKIHVYTKAEPSFVFRARSFVYSEMRSAFESSGIWSSMTNDVPASRYSLPGNPLSIDCLYKTADRFHIIQAVDLSVWSDDASRLASCVSSLREGVLRVESIPLDLLTIVASRRAHWTREAQQQYQFNLNLMLEVGIHVVPLSNIGQVVAQALSEAA